MVGSYVLVVWVGTVDGTGDPAFVGARAAAPLCFSVVDAIDATDRTPAAPGFRVPATLRKVELCAALGD